jgi:hypothetical protein
MWPEFGMTNQGISEGRKIMEKNNDSKALKFPHLVPLMNRHRFRVEVLNEGQHVFTVFGDTYKDLDPYMYNRDRSLHHRLLERKVIENEVARHLPPGVGWKKVKEFPAEVKE